MPKMLWSCNGCRSNCELLVQNSNVPEVCPMLRGAMRFVPVDGDLKKRSMGDTARVRKSIRKKTQMFK